MLNLFHFCFSWVMSKLNLNKLSCKQNRYKVWTYFWNERIGVHLLEFYPKRIEDNTFGPWWTTFYIMLQLQLQILKIGIQMCCRWGLEKCNQCAWNSSMVCYICVYALLRECSCLLNQPCHLFFCLWELSSVICSGSLWPSLT